MYDDIKFINSLHHHPEQLEARPDFSHMHPGEAYLSFVAQLRQKLAEHEIHSGRFKGTRYLPVEGQPVKHLNLLLVSGLETGACILLRIRYDNVYLVGYKPLSPANRPRPREPNDRPWYGFADIDLSRTFGTENPQALCCEGNYPDLVRVAGVGIQDTSLGREPLDTAIQTLAESDNEGNQAEVAYSLMVIIQMVCEASRFQDVAQKIASAIEGGSSIQPDHTMYELYTSWNHQSQDSQQPPQPPAQPEEPEPLQYIERKNRREKDRNAKKAKIGNLRLAKR